MRLPPARQGAKIVVVMTEDRGHSTTQLVHSVQAGDTDAREALFAHCLPPLRRWAHGRLPGYARDLSDTNDLVQVTLMRALNRLDDFDAEGAGSFLAYLRRILLNTVKDEIRRTRRRGPSVTVDEAALEGRGVSPVERLVGRQELACYESALARLSRRQQEALVLRIEFGMSFPEIAAETDSTPDAARMLFHRARAQLAVEMRIDAGPAA